MKKASCLIIALMMLMPMCCSCSLRNGTTDSDKITIVATLFPQYDFARQIAGDYADIYLLLSPGVESHSYEPTPQDIIKISEADIFLYTGEYMESWAHDLISGIDSDVLIVDVSKGIELDASQEHEHGEAGHEHSNYDPHIWTDPTLAVTMVQNITSALTQIDEAHAQEYHAKTEEYCGKLLKLDSDMSFMLDGAKQDIICFADRFAMHYFVKRYGLDYISAYDSCSEETEPSAKAVADIIDIINTKQIAVIFYGELSESSVAHTIARDTGTKPLLLHSCHNVSKAEYDSGASYLSLMYQNLENLREGLN